MVKSDVFFPGANLNYSFDLDSIFDSIQEFFWTLEFFSLQERGGVLADR
jgi:hypothetical protein